MMTRILAVTAVMLACAAPAAVQAQQDPDTFTLSPRAYVQFDLRRFPGWDGVTAGEGRMSRDTVEFRRIRLGADGTWRRLNFELSLDPQDTDGTLVKDAYGQIRFSPAFRVRVGQFKVPGSRDYGVSARDLELMERAPLATSLATGRDIGARLDGRVARVNYDVGVFAGDGVNRDDRAGLTTASRVVLDLPHGVEIGGSVSAASTRAHDDEAPNGPAMYSTSGFRFADGVYTQGLRLRLGVDAQWTPGRWQFVAETLHLRDDRHEQGLDHEDLPDVAGTGFSASVVRRLRTRREGGGNPIVTAMLRRPLDVAVRYDFLSIDDTGSNALESVRPRATNVRARGAHGLTLGSTWSAGRWLKLLGNVTLEQFTEARSAPEPGRKGVYITLGARFQLELP